MIADEGIEPSTKTTQEARKTPDRGDMKMMKTEGSRMFVLCVSLPTPVSVCVCHNVNR